MKKYRVVLILQDYVKANSEQEAFDIGTANIKNDAVSVKSEILVTEVENLQEADDGEV